VNGAESERLRRAVERLMDGQREALEVLRRALDGEAPAEGALGDLEHLLEGALDDARHPGDGRRGRRGRGVIVLGRVPHLPPSSRAAVGRVNLSPKGEIMGICKQMFVVRRREDETWT
jgi:hypothetical protein